MTIGIGPTAQLCNWACSTQYEDLPPEVRKESITLLYDQVGCMIACATLISCQPIVSVIRRLGAPGECSIVGHPLRTSVTSAALVNGTIGHGDEVDSTGQHGTGHVASVIVPTVLSVGQYVAASGKQLLRALAIGAEVAGRCSSVLAHYETRREFSHGLGNTMGAAVSAGLLLGLNAEQMEHALGLAAGGACGLNSQHTEELHQTKSLDKGRAAESGVLSALLAYEGCHGPKEPLATENGFFDAFLGLRSAGHDVVKDLGENYLMRQVAYKRYSVGGPDQTPLYAFLQLIKKHNLTPDDIEQIEVSVSRNSFHGITTNQHPSVNMQTILAMAAVYGEITFSHAHDLGYAEDPRVKSFKDKSRIFIIPRSGPSTRGQRLETGITVRTRNGEVLREELRFPLMTEAEIREKFHSLAGLRMNGGHVTDLETKLLTIETVQNVAPLIRELELPY